MTQEIKPCPFCGSSDCEVVVTIYQKGGYKRKNCMVCCKGCGSSGTETDEEFDAVSQWNKRTWIENAKELNVATWQPIETAPKDGSRILLFYSKSRKEGVTETAVGRWEIQKYHDRPRPYWENEKYIGDVSYKRENPPTHWMPLPSPPKP